MMEAMGRLFEWVVEVIYMLVQHILACHGLVHYHFLQVLYDTVQVHHVTVNET